MAEVKKIPKKTITVLEPKSSLVVDKERHHQKRVAAYCRVSTDNEEQLTSYVNQKKVYTEMIAANPEWCFAGLYADEGISGTQAKFRPEFKKMIEDCYAGKIDYIITKSVSRFARNTVECLDYVRILKSRGIGIIFEEQNIDTLKTDSELYLVIYAGFAQSESESISKNVTWTFRKKFEEGQVPFRYSQMLGYRKGEDGNPEIVPEEAVIIEDIFNLYLEGKTIRDVAEAIKEKYPIIPNGKKINFYPGTIQAILANEKYCGDAILQKTVTIDCITKTRRKNTGEAPMYYVQDNHPAIIDRDKFNRVQTELVSRTSKRPQSSKTSLTAQGKYSKYALTDVMLCGECGSRYKRCTWARNGKKKIVWRCVNRLDYGTKYCKTSPTIEDEDIKAAVVRAINRFNEEDAHTYVTLMKATLSEALGVNSTQEEMDLLLSRVEALNKKMLDIVNESVAQGEDIETHEDEFKSISDEIARLNERIEAIKKKANEDISAKGRMELIENQLTQMKGKILKYDDLTETIVRQMIECIKVFDDGKIEVIFGGGYSFEEMIGKKYA